MTTHEAAGTADAIGLRRALQTGAEVALAPTVIDGEVVRPERPPAPPPADARYPMPFGRFALIGLGVLAAFVAVGFPVGLGLGSAHVGLGLLTKAGGVMAGLLGVALLVLVLRVAWRVRRAMRPRQV